MWRIFLFFRRFSENKKNVFLFVWCVSVSVFMRAWKMQTVVISGIIHIKRMEHIDHRTWNASKIPWITSFSVFFFFFSFNKSVFHSQNHRFAVVNVIIRYILLPIAPHKKQKTNGNWKKKQLRIVDLLSIQSKAITPCVSIASNSPCNTFYTDCNIKMWIW